MNLRAQHFRTAHQKAALHRRYLSQIKLAGFTTPLDFRSRLRACSAIINSPSRRAWAPDHSPSPSQTPQVALPSAQPPPVTKFTPLTVVVATIGGRCPPGGTGARLVARVSGTSSLRGKH